jgi:hypothetical protein
MADNNSARENLIRRRDEINQQLNRVNAEQRIELDRDPEEQAIQLEQDQVAVSMEMNLRRELAAIEDQLFSLDE